MAKTEKQSRAGRYIQQPEGHRAFIPNPLPPKPPVRLQGEIQNLLSEADLALGRLDGSINTLPHPDLFVAMYVRKEAVLSSQIEGTLSSLEDVLTAEARAASPERPGDADEVLNYIRAMNHGLARLSALPLSVRLLREIHAELMRGVRGQHKTPGELRTSQNWIGQEGTPLEEAAFIPPPAHEAAEALSQLERFLHRPTSLPLLIRVGLVHAQFETIHPFLDGNGRLGRLMITFMLCEQGVLRKPVLYLSDYLKQRRQRYYDLLQAVREEGAWEEWLVFFLQGVLEVSRQAADTVRSILLLRESHRQRVTDFMGRAAANGHRVLEQLYDFPIISVSEVQELIGTTYPAANNVVARLTEQGILTEVTGQKRNRLFRYGEYVGLFSNDPLSPEEDA